MITQLMLAAVLAAPVPVPSNVIVHTGQIEGAEYRVEVPSRWNGTVLLYSHGSYPEGYLPEEVSLVAQPAAKPELLARGYALAASNYNDPFGYAVPEALRDQMKLLDWVGSNVGRPKRVISWGTSQGGLASLMIGERNQRRIDGTVSMCGSLAGAVGKYNQLLDTQYVIRTLLAPELELVGITDPRGNVVRARTAIIEAMKTPSGRARLALAGAVGSVPGWSTAHEPRPADVTAQVGAMVTHLTTVLLGTWGDGRVDLEARAGGNPSWNTGVDYRRQLLLADERPLVVAAYREAGLDLGEDLRQLNDGTRVSASPAAVSWLEEWGSVTGRGGPVVTLHPIGDTVGPEHQREFGSHARDVRQLFVNRAGHCMHTAAEELTALRVLEDRISTGRWPSVSSDVLNREAAGHGPELHSLYDWTVDRTAASDPAFVKYTPGQFLR